MSLFDSRPFRSAAGLALAWKMECNYLTYEDWQHIAKIVSPGLNFGRVEGVPTGGLVLADAVRRYATKGSDKLLIVDDVLTTGESMERLRDGREALGFVLFARRSLPSWVMAYWELGPWLR